jgi:hypothetical protein
MLKIRDGVWLMVLAVLGTLWYADRSLLADRLQSVRTGIEIERSNNRLLSDKLRERASPR